MRFGVSTTPVRKAFVALAREGLVRQDAHRGVVVFAPTIEELEELYAIRIALESLATEQAAEQNLAKLDVLVGELADVVGTSAYTGVNPASMRAVTTTGDRRTSLENVDLARATAGDVRVRIAAAGVCHSDLTSGGATGR